MKIEGGQRVHESSTGALHGPYAFPRDDSVFHDATDAIGEREDGATSFSIVRPSERYGARHLPFGRSPDFHG
jgi:hypothetical protein